MPVNMSAYGRSMTVDSLLQMALLRFMGVDEIHLILAVHLSEMLPKSRSPGFGDVDEEEFLQGPFRRKLPDDHFG